MTNEHAITVLKIELNKARKDFYTDRIKAIELAINALRKQKEGNNGQDHKRSRRTMH